MPRTFGWQPTQQEQRIRHAIARRLHRLHAVSASKVAALEVTVIRILHATGKIFESNGIKIYGFVVIIAAPNSEDESEKTLLPRREL